MAKDHYLYGLGRRKSSTARVRLYHGKGKITINDKTADEYLDGNEALLWRMNEPLRLTAKENAYDITIKVKGGGHAGQVDAIKLGISKALASISDDLRATLKKAGLLKRDAREKERKKYGLRRARKKEQYSKR